MTKQYKTGPIMAALLVAGFVGLFSEKLSIKCCLRTIR